MSNFYAVAYDEEDKIDNLMNDCDTEFVMEEKVAKEKLRMTVMMEVIFSFLTLTSILYQEKMGKTRPKDLREVKESKFPSFTWKKRAHQYEMEECTLKAEVIIKEIQEHCTPFDMFRKVNNLDELINLIVVQSNLYAHNKMVVNFKRM